jgi:hypothetical protein
LSSNRRCRGPFIAQGFGNRSVGTTHACQRGCRAARILVQGEGHRNDPFRYYLPRRIEKWHQNFLEDFFKRLELNPRPCSPLLP